MTNPQTGGPVSNSAASSLPTSLNSAVARLGQIVPKPLISRKVLTLRGGFLEAERGFVPALRERRRSAPRARPPAVSRAGVPRAAGQGRIEGVLASAKRIL